MKQKRKRESKRQIPTAMYIIISLALVIGIFISGLLLGTEFNTAPMQTLQAEFTATQNMKATHNPMILMTQTVSAIETQWADINITQTAIDQSKSNP